MNAKRRREILAKMRGLIVGKETFLTMLKKIEYSSPMLKGECEVLFEFYIGGEVEEKEVLLSLERIEKKSISN